MSEQKRISQFGPRTAVIQAEGELVARRSTEIILPASMQGLTLGKALDAYEREHIVANGATADKIRRFGYVKNHLLRVFGRDRNIETLERNDGRRYTEKRLAEGVMGTTAGRELTFVIAACNHAKREKRTKHEFNIWKPERGAPRVRVLDHDEERRLMLVPKPRRAQLFLLLAFNTGARARAIEEVTWPRVDLSRRTIDYRVPGVKYGNKRRVVVPINDRLLRRLEAAHAIREDEYVIGLGPRGRCSTTFHIVKDAYRAIGLVEQGVCRHVARHTFATRLLRKRVPIAEVAKLLGDRVEMVEKVYGHLMPSDLMHAVNAL